MREVTQTTQFILNILCELWSPALQNAWNGPTGGGKISTRNVKFTHVTGYELSGTLATSFLVPYQLSGTLPNSFLGTTFLRPFPDLIVWLFSCHSYSVTSLPLLCFFLHSYQISGSLDSGSCVFILISYQKADALKAGYPGSWIPRKIGRTPPKKKKTWKSWVRKAGIWCIPKNGGLPLY